MPPRNIAGWRPVLSQMAVAMLLSDGCSCLMCGSAYEMMCERLAAGLREPTARLSSLARERHKAGGPHDEYTRASRDGAASVRADIAIISPQVPPPKILLVILRHRMARYRKSMQNILGGDVTSDVGIAPRHQSTGHSVRAARRY